jgi:hypothetical protein
MLRVVGLVDVLADKILAKLDQRDKARGKNVPISISTSAPARVGALFSRMDFRAIIGDAPSAEGKVSFDAFPWDRRSEQDQMPGVRTHIEEQLKKLGVPLGRGGYKIEDVRMRGHLLDVSDDKVGVLRGGPDFAVVPFNTSKVAIRQAVCILWHIKTDISIQPCVASLNRFESEAFLALLAARCLSDQPGVLVVLTDLISGALLTELEYSAQYKSFSVVQYDVMTLNQMGSMVAQFLARTAVPDASFRPVQSHPNPRDIPAVVFKKTKLSHDKHW